MSDSEVPTPAGLDLLDPSCRRDPYPVYERLRAEAPVQWSPGLGMWVVTPYDEVKQVIQDSSDFSVERFGAGDDESRPQRSGMYEVRSILRDWAVYRDPPEHTRMRALLGRTFTSRWLSDLRPRIEAIVDDLVERIKERGKLDFVREFAFPLPATVIGSMLGVPGADLEQVKVWSDQIASFIGGAQSGRDNVEEAKRGLLEICNYFHGLADARLASPRDDLLSMLLSASETGDQMSQREVVANCVLLLFAGHETTTNLLANGLFHLLRNGEQLEKLRGSPDLVPDAVEELLRYDAPVAGTIRIARRDLTLRGSEIRTGDTVAAMIASANRDPLHFSNPDALDVTRGARSHLTFGQGIHFCLGAPLARLEAQIAFDKLLERFARISLVEEEPRWKAQIFFRGLEELWVECAS